MLAGVDVDCVGNRFMYNSRSRGSRVKVRGDQRILKTEKKPMYLLNKS